MRKNTFHRARNPKEKPIALNSRKASQPGSLNLQTFFHSGGSFMGEKAHFASYTKSSVVLSAPQHPSLGHFSVPLVSIALLQLPHPWQRHPGPRGCCCSICAWRWVPGSQASLVCHMEACMSSPQLGLADLSNVYTDLRDQGDGWRRKIPIIATDIAGSRPSLAWPVPISQQLLPCSCNLHVPSTSVAFVVNH